MAGPRCTSETVSECASAREHVAASEASERGERALRRARYIQSGERGTEREKEREEERERERSGSRQTRSEPQCIRSTR